MQLHCQLQLDVCESSATNMKLLSCQRESTTTSLSKAHSTDFVLDSVQCAEAEVMEDPLVLLAEGASEVL